MTTQKGLFALIACAFVFGTFGIFVKFLDKTFGPYEQVLLRNIVAALISLISAFICHTPITYKGISPKMLFLYASTWVPIVITFTLAVQYIKVSAAVSIFYAANLCTAYFIGSRLFHEKITLYAWIGILVSFVGLAWYAYPFHITSQSSIGYMLIFASGCLDAISSALNKHLSLQLNRESAALIRSLFGILVAGVFVLMNNDTIAYTDFTNTNIIILILFGGMLFLINSLVMYGFRMIDLHFGTFILSAEIIFATILGILFLGEVPTFNEWIGAGCIFASIFISTIPHLHKSTSTYINVAK